MNDEEITVTVTPKTVTETGINGYYRRHYWLLPGRLMVTVSDHTVTTF